PLSPEWLRGKLRKATATPPPCTKGEMKKTPVLGKSNRMLMCIYGLFSSVKPDVSSRIIALTNRGGCNRTTHRTKSGKKLYAVRDKAGRFKDIQTYKRAHDIKRKSKDEK